MADKKYSTEMFLRIYADGSGDFVQVGPDGDGLDLVDIRQHDNGKEHARITMSREQAAKVAEALGEYLDRPL